MPGAQHIQKSVIIGLYRNKRNVMQCLHLSSDGPDRDIRVISDISLRNAVFGFSSFYLGFVIDKVAGFSTNSLIVP
jgi:hypothetical protein